MNQEDDVTSDRANQNTTTQGTAASRLLSATDIWSAEPTPHAPIEEIIEPLTPLLAEIARNETRPGPRPAAMKARRSSARHWPPRRLSLALQGGGTFGAFTWGVLERILEEPEIELDTISGASGGTINALLVASGLVEGGHDGARARLSRFWIRLMHDASFRSLMLIGAFSPAGSSVAFGPTLRSGHFDPFDLDPLRQALVRDVNFEALRDRACPKLLVSATRIRDGSQQVFTNAAITADVALASTCPPLVHCAVDIEGEAYWDGGYAGNPPLVRLVQESAANDVLVIQVTPSRDGYVPITPAAIDRRLDQIAANATLNAEMAALAWARPASLPSLRLSKLAAEDEFEGLAQRSSTDLGRGFIRQLHRSGRYAAERWLTQGLAGEDVSSECDEFALA